MADVAKLADELLALTIMEAKELNDILEEKGIKVAAPVAMAGPAAMPAQLLKRKTNLTSFSLLRVTRKST